MSVVPLRQAEAPLYGVLTTRVQPAALWEQALVCVWIFVTFVTFPGDELLLYPSALLFCFLFVRYSEFTFPLALKCSVLLLIPGLAALSFGWSPAPSEALRTGIMMMVNFVIMITIATRLTRQQIIRALMVAGLVAIIMEAPYIDNFAHGGYSYGSKNIFAIRMLIVTLAAVAVAYDPGENFFIRMAALPIAAVGFLYVVLAQSATALLLAVGGIVMLTLFWLIWQPAVRIRHMRSLVVLLGIVILFAGTIIVVALPSGKYVDKLLTSMGKDSTLTNRTIIWETGERIADQNPVLGLGMEGFWRPETGAAQSLNELDHKRPGTKLSFHNTYIEVRVHLGYVGLAALLIALSWSYWNTLRSWLRSRGMAASFFLTLATIILITTFTESYMFSVFDTLLLMFYLGGITALADKHHLGKRQLVRLKPDSPDNTAT